MMKQQNKKTIDSTQMLAFPQKSHSLRSAKLALDASEQQLSYRTDVLETWVKGMISQHGEDAIRQIVCKTISNNQELRVSPALRDWACSVSVGDIPSACETKLHPTYLNAIAYYLNKRDLQNAFTL